jgi:hypothetical protein
LPRDVGLSRAAAIDIDPLPESPTVLPQDVERMQCDIENWIHNR